MADCSSFNDPWNPSSGEVREWAYSANVLDPCQDWELALCWARHERDYIEFASDNQCPNRIFFLRLLYFIVGNAVRSHFVSIQEPLVRGFLDLAKDSQHPDIRLWRERSLALLKHPESFDYDSWCGGRLATEAAA